MSSYEAFFPYVIPEVIGAPEPLALNAIRNSVIEFCEKSLVLTRDHDPITILPNIVDYDLEPPDGYLVVKVQQAWLDDQPLTPLAPDFVREASVYNRLFETYEAAPSTPKYYLQKDERSITVWQLPDKKYTNGLTMRVALKPTRASTEVEDVVFEDYVETIAAGALMRLMMSPGKAYTNPDLAAVHKAIFTQGINTARQRASHGQVRSVLSVQLKRI
jgi:hypothetical protein